MADRMAAFTGFPPVFYLSVSKSFKLLKLLDTSGPDCITAVKLRQTSSPEALTSAEQPKFHFTFFLYHFSKLMNKV